MQFSTEPETSFTTNNRMPPQLWTIAMYTIDIHCFINQS